MADETVISNKPKSRREDATAVVMRLRENGHIAYFAGGCVRDMLLGLEPKDWDVATDAPPNRVQELFPRTQAVGAAFGVILVRQGPSQIEVATFRSDGTYEDGRRPTEVRFTTAEKDAQRRDFTINGLFLDPAIDNVIDFVGGQDDLKARLMRAIGYPETRFEEDHLRMLRAVRFAARFGFDIEPKTSEAIIVHARQLIRISPERIAEELRMMLTATTRARAWEMLCIYGFPGIILRFHAKTIDPHPEYVPGRAGLFEKILPDRRISFGFALAIALAEYSLVDARSPDDWKKTNFNTLVKAVRQSLRISNEEFDEMENTLRGAMDLMADEERTDAAVKRFLARPTATQSRLLWNALPFPRTELSKRLEDRLAALEKTDFAPPPLVTGDDLTAAGLKPGKLFKLVLNRVYDAQLEDQVRTKPEALELALRIADQST